MTSSESAVVEMAICDETCTVDEHFRCTLEEGNSMEDREEPEDKDQAGIVRE